METLIAVLAGWLVATSVYLMLRRSFVRYLFGLILLGNAANLIIFGAGRLTRGEPAIVPPGLSRPIEMVSNALPQALVLTAIVISFGLVAFAFALTLRVGEELGTVDTDAMRSAEPAETVEPASDATIARAG
jgi:multicomponent Na+:H+ antiporter subunit C